MKIVVNIWSLIFEERKIICTIFGGRFQGKYHANYKQFEFTAINFYFEPC